MILSLKKSIFLFLFACFQVLLFFSFFTAYELIVTALFLVFLLFYFYYFKLRVVVNTKVVFLWLGVIFFLFLSSIFTHSISLSIKELTFHVTAFVVFIFFRSLSSSKIIKKQEFVLTFLLIGLVLSGFFIALFSFPDLSNFLPPVNVFTTKHGHSHFTALLLILIPLAWWFVFSEKHKMFNYKGSILLLFYTLLIFTFGRFAMFLSLLQLPFLYSFIKQKRIKKIYLYSSGLALVLSLVIISLFSVNSSENCAVHEFRSQVCKPISKEIRPEYFKQAFVAFKAYPLFGYGPGTFSLITKKFNPVVQHSSIYTHNYFLQILSESGVFAGLTYILLIIFLYKNMSVVLSSSFPSLNKFIFLGLVSLLLNAFIDFDWNISPVYQMTLIFIAVVLWDYPNNISKKVKDMNLKKNILFKNIWLFFLYSLVILGSVNAVTKALIIMGKEKTAFNVFPYFQSQSVIFLEESSLSSEEKGFLYKIYRNHNKFILDEIKNSEELEKKKELYSQLSVVSPWEAINTDYYQILKDLGDYKTLGLVSYKGLNLLFYFDEIGLGKEYKFKKEAMEYLFWAANEHIKNDEFAVAVPYYKSILVVQKWIFHVKQPIFLEYRNLNPVNVDKFLQDVGVNIENFGKNSDKVQEWYSKNLPQSNKL